MPGPYQQDESLTADGFIGQYWHTRTTTARRPAVLVLDGLPGGMPTQLPALLASNGYPALWIAYFNMPLLSPTLSGIPLEYFARALAWLARQPGVDPGAIAVLGISAGSEAAQLLGVHYPSLVHAVIASVPSDAELRPAPQHAWDESHRAADRGMAVSRGCRGQFVGPAAVTAPPGSRGYRQVPAGRCRGERRGRR